MEQTRISRAGWRAEEADILWRAVDEAAQSGQPLRGVFERVGQRLGRKPNSIRNYYYTQLREQPREGLKRAAPFETFSEEEVRALVRAVLAARGAGQSVRACVMKMSGGNRSLMLRYQNKYRSVLKNRPRLIEEVCRELEREGIPYVDPLARRAESSAQELRAAAHEKAMRLQDPAVLKIFEGMDALLERAAQSDRTLANDRMRVQLDITRMRLSDISEASAGLVQACKEYMGEASGAQPDTAAFLQTLAGHIARVESALQ